MKILLNTVLFVIVSLFSVNVTAQSYKWKDSVVVTPRVYVYIGGYFPSMLTNLRIDSDSGLGTDISLEDDFKMPSSLSVFKADVLYRVKNRTQFVFSFTSLQRDNNLSLDKDIEFGDTVFHANANIDTYFNTNYYGFTWRYSIWNNPGWNAGFSIGLRTLQLQAGIKANLNQQSYQADAELFAPAMLFGIHGSGYITNRLLARYSMEYFQISIGEIKATVMETKFSLDYFIHKNVGIGVGSSTSLYVVKEVPFNEDFEGRIRYAFVGFQANVSARF